MRCTHPASRPAASRPPCLHAEQEGDAVYIAPELLQALPSAHCDVFSLGLVLYELAAQLELPVEAPSGSDSWHRLRSGELPFPPAPERSAELKVRSVWQV